MIVDIVIPTVTGREELLALAIHAYEQHSAYEVRIKTVLNKPGAGIAWNEGAAWFEGQVRDGFYEQGDYLHLGADDIEAVPGWDHAGAYAVECGFYPSCEILTKPGRIVEWGRSFDLLPDLTPVPSGVLPFMSWEMWQQIGPTIEAHYYTDDYLSWRADLAGFTNVYREGYGFVHNLAQHGRRWGGLSIEEKMVIDRRVFDRAKVAYLRTVSAASGR